MNKKLKNVAIVFLGDFSYDARCINMALSLMKENYQVSVIHNQLSTKPLDLKFKKIKFFHLNIQPRKIITYFSFYNKVKFILQKNNFDILIAGDLYSLANICKYKNKSHLIYDCREIYFELSAHQKHPIKKYISYIYENYFLQFVDTVFVTAESDLNLLQSKYSRHYHLKWYTLYNFPYNFHNKGNINLYQKLNIPKQHKLLLYQGVIQKHRGIRALIEVINSSSSLSAIIVGDGPALDQYKKIVSNKNLNDKIYFLGKIPYLQMLSYTASCDIGWLIIKPKGISNKLALPNKLFEYTLAGLPVISTQLPNIFPIIKKNNFGICVQENNLEEQIQAINNIINNYNKYDHVAGLTIKQYIWNVQHKQFIKALYNEF